MQNVSFVMSLSMEAVQGYYSGFRLSTQQSSCVQGHNKRDTVQALWPLDPKYTSTRQALYV